MSLSMPQEELKIANLIHSILIEDEILNRERELNHRLEKKRASKVALIKCGRNATVVIFQIRIMNVSWLYIHLVIYPPRATSLTWFT